jgi:hypothetical protein
LQGNQALPKGNLSKLYEEGVLFVTYSLLVHSAKRLKETNEPQAADSKYHIQRGSRLQQIVDWLRGGDGDPLIVSWTVDIVRCPMRADLSA